MPDYRIGPPPITVPVFQIDPTTGLPMEPPRMDPQWLNWFTILWQLVR